MFEVCLVSTFVIVGTHLEIFKACGTLLFREIVDVKLPEVS
jgi:hypothetical protein